MAPRRKTPKTAKPTTESAPTDAPEDAQADLNSVDDFDEALKNFTCEHAGDRPTDAEIDADVARFLETLR